MTELPAGSVHACITSPPYWGLRDYKAGEDMIGLEPTPEAHIENLLAVFREVRRVLRDDGTLWLNYGDAYSANRSYQVTDSKHTDVGNSRGMTVQDGYQTGDLMMLPHRVAMALQADGWLVRSAIVWAKGVSFCPTYSGSVMPESVNGTRWERCRVRVAGRRTAYPNRDAIGGGRATIPHTGDDLRPSEDRREQWSDCPGCDKCNANGGYVLRRGSWRCTSGYELIFMCAKAGGYFCDAEAVREKSLRGGDIPGGNHHGAGEHGVNAGWAGGEVPPNRNPRNVWTINPAPFPDAHFATYPPALIEPIVKVSTSERGVCPECGAPWARVVETGGIEQDDTPFARPTAAIVKGATKETAQYRGNKFAADGYRPNMHIDTRTLGWRPTCECPVPKDIGGVWELVGGTAKHPPIPATILDPFGGSGTTGMVANQHGRDAIICELNEEYAAMAKQRIGKALRPNTYRDDSIVAEVDGGLFQ